MNIRFLADEDIGSKIIEGLQRREPAIDVLDVKTAGLRRSRDPTLLEVAAEQSRIVLTHDRNTMTRHHSDRLFAGLSTPGLFVLSQRPSAVGALIETLLLIWTTSEPEEWRNRIVYLPFG